MQLFTQFTLLNGALEFFHFYYTIARNQQLIIAVSEQSIEITRKNI